MYPLSSHSISWCFKCYDRGTERETDKGGDCSSEGMTDEPDICVWIHVGDVVIEILEGEKDKERKYNFPMSTAFMKRIADEVGSQDYMAELTHCSNGRINALPNDRILQTSQSTLVSPLITITNWRPSVIHSPTTTTKQQVVIELIVFRRGTARSPKTGRGPFERDDDGGIVGSGEYVTSETIGVFFPAKGNALCR